MRDLEGRNVVGTQFCARATGLAGPVWFVLWGEAPRAGVGTAGVPGAG